MGFGMISTKGRRFPIEVLTGDEVRLLMGVTSRRGSCGVRDRALIATLYRSGLRIREALDLMPKDVDMDGGIVAVLDGKGHKARVVAVDGETIALLELWLARRASIGVAGRAPIFSTLAGEPMSDVQVRQHLKVLAVKAGIEKRVHPHGLRHSIASAMVAQGVEVPVIQRALGHTSLQTTQRYVDHIRPERVIAAMKEITW